MAIRDDAAHGWLEGHQSVSSPMAALVRTLETYSLDVAAGIVGASVFLGGFALSPAPPWTSYFCLGCAAVAVYNLDHLLDVVRSPSSTSPRRVRHRARARSMAFLAVLATMLGSAVALTLPSGILLGGGILLVFLGAYFAGVLRGMHGVPKRLWAASGWAAAAALPSFAVSLDRLEPRLLAATAILAGTAWMNLQSYATVDGPAEGSTGEAPGPRLRGATAVGVGLLVVVAVGLDPSHAAAWLVLGAVGALQAFLAALPANLVHPVGEWSFALLALVRLHA